MASSASTMRGSSTASPQKLCREQTPPRAVCAPVTPALHAAASSRQQRLQRVLCGSAAHSATPPLAAQQPVAQSPVQPRSQQPACTAAHEQDGTAEAEEYDVLGIGQLMIDYAAAVGDDMLAALQVPKGGRRIISVEEKAAVMEQLQGFDSQVSAGGSLANSLVGIAQLAAARERFLLQQSKAAKPAAAAAAATSTTTSSSSSTSTSPSPVPQRRLRVAMAGCCGGSDALGEFGRAQMAAAGVDIISVDGDGDDAAAAAAQQSWAGSATGTVMVFTTPDAQRSFLSSFSPEDSLHLTPALLRAVSRARLVVIEGYLWELPGAADVIPAVVKHARSVGTLVVMTAGDASVLQRHGANVLQAIQEGVDMYICNSAEAEALVQFVRCKQPAQEQQRVLTEEMEEHSVTLDPQGSASSLDSVWEQQQQHSSSGSNHADGSSSGGQVAACELASACPLVVVTDGSRGSFITALGQLTVVPPYWRSLAPVDTCGAGDAYCGGFLFAFLLGLDLHAMGHVAAKTASAVISRHGPQLLAGDADTVAGVPLGRSSSLAAQLMSGSAAGSAGKLGSLGVGVDAAVGAVTASQ